MNKITCICLGVSNMSLAIRFYRDGLGFETCEKGDEPQVIFFNTPGTKFELYPLGLLAKDISAPACRRLPRFPHRRNLHENSQPGRNPEKVHPRQSLN